MSEKVYTIEDGEYSDYHIIGVYDSREKAEYIQAVIGGEIVERPLNPGFDGLNQGLRLFRVLILRDGTTEWVDEVEPTQWTIAGEPIVWRRSRAGNPMPDCMDTCVWAKDKAHAVKIANEQRTRIIAEGRWE